MSEHLFISHFRQFMKKNRKRFVGILALILVLMGEEHALEWLLIDDDGTFERIMMHDFYENTENIDNLYVGSSHVFCDLNPAILDEINGKNNFNLSTSAQPLIASYYLLIEADKRNDLTCVYLDLWNGLLMEDNGKWKEPGELLTSWQVLDQMKFSENKLKWMLDSTDYRHVYLSMFPSIRYKNRLLDSDYLAEQLHNKTNSDYLCYDDLESYVRKGYSYTEHKAEELYCTTSVRTVESPRELSETAKEYLIKIIDYCDKNNIKLRLCANPVSDWELCQTGDYDNYVMQMKNLVSQYGLEYYDFNLCRKEYLDIGDNIYWSDNNHLNKYGAELYSNVFGIFFEKLDKGEIQGSDYFYDSYQEKLDDMEERVFGVVVEEIDDERKAEYFASFSIEPMDAYRLFHLSTVGNLKSDSVETYVYRVETGSKDKILLQEWDRNNRYIFPVDAEGGKLYIKVRNLRTKEEYGEVVIEYKGDSGNIS